MSQRPPRDLDWIPDDATGINVPSETKQNDGWIIEKPPRQFFNWMWNRVSRWIHYFSGQSQEFIVIDSTNANEKDYDTLAAYLAGSPVAGDKVLVKEDQTITSQMVIPSDITLKFLDGVGLLSSTNIASSFLQLGSNIIIEGVLNLILSQTGITAKAVEFNGDNVIGKINVENSSTGTLTTAYHINANKVGNEVAGIAQNTGGGILSNIFVDNSTKNTNYIIIRDIINNNIIGSAASLTRSGLVELATSAETITGADAQRAVTPAGLQAKISSTSAKGIVELATPAETITGTDAERATTPAGVAAAIGAAGEGVAKAWVNFDGTGTVAIRDSFNVTSIVDNGTGDYTINWDTDFANINYTVVAGMGSGGPGGAFIHNIPRVAPAVGSYRVTTLDTSPIAQDAAYVNLAAFGDQ